VLEQRIARVHRMGQSRPVRVINLVTRGTIEEQVLRTLEAKQGLFTGLFAGDEDEIPFAAVTQSRFLDTVRELIGERARGQRPAAAVPSEVSERPPAVPPTLPPGAAHSDLWQSAAHLLEGVCALLAAIPPAVPMPDDVRDRLRTAVRALADRLGPPSPLA
jgi:hypothetical protein